MSGTLHIRLSMDRAVVGAQKIGQSEEYKKSFTSDTTSILVKQQACKTNNVYAE